jgi:aspartyl-tRNA(Asn)/glutamyl-tRNA(Gln) amidotransferase subunit C
MNIKDVENLAELAKLDMSGEEKEAMLKDMDSILGYVKQIEEVEVGDVKPSYDVYNVWREDLPVSGGQAEPREFSKEIITEEFPDKQDGFLKVKKIL